MTLKTLSRPRSQIVKKKVGKKVEKKVEKKVRKKIGEMCY
jgi:hypothetical protein